MAVKYTFSYLDTENILHECIIDDPDHVGASTVIKGRCYLQYPEVDEPLECIRGSALRIDLEANAGLTFSDLYSEEERNFEVTYIRDSVTQFVGFLKPDGLYQDFVNNEWVISLDCVDGLGLLRNLSYVDSNGLTYSGIEKEIVIIARCLKRTNISADIWTQCLKGYFGMGDVDVFNNASIDQDRFVKEDGDTIMNCDEVIRSILEKYCCVITSYQGDWYIYTPYNVAQSATLEFYQYNSEGIDQSNSPFRNIGFSLGSQINDFYPHHANANQRIEIKPSFGAYRINYKYGFLSSVNVGNNFENNGTTITGWTIINAPLVDLPTTTGVDILDVDSGQTVALESDTISVDEGTVLKMTIDHEGIDTEAGDVVAILPIIDDGSDLYGMNSSGDWFILPLINTVNIFGNERKTYEITSKPFPVSGDLYIRVITSMNGSDDIMRIYSLDLNLLQPENENIEGEIHTVERINKPSSVIKKNKEVFNGDSLTDPVIYIGSIYKADGVTPTTGWSPDRTVFDDQPILRIMGYETLLLSQSPSQLFSGDIYGFMPYLSRVTIDNVPGVFLIQGYDYDTRANVTSLVLRQIFSDSIASDYTYEFRFDYGAVVEPTIKG